MISTGLKHLHALPSLPSTTVNWLPVDVCASSITSALFTATTTTEPPAYTVHNLVNPSTISWSTFLSALAAATTSQSSPSGPSTPAFETVSIRDWVTMLEKAADDDEGRQHGEEEEVPGLKLLGFFQDMAAGSAGSAESAESVDGGGGGAAKSGTSKGKWGKNGEGVEFATASVRGARAVDEEMVRLWLERWRDERFV